MFYAWTPIKFNTENLKPKWYSKNKLGNGVAVLLEDPN